MKYDKKTAVADSNNADKTEERLGSIRSNIVNDTLTTLIIEATSRCNLACAYCGMHSKDFSSKDGKGEKLLKMSSNMDLNLFNEIIKKCLGLKKLKVLYLHGLGEPLLNPNIIKMVKIAKRADIAEQIIIVTNGVLLNKNMFRNLVKAGASSIRVSLDIISPDRFREVKGFDFGKVVLANVDACVDLMKIEHLPVKFIILCVDPDSKDKDMREETKNILKHFEKKIENIPNVYIQYRKIFDWVGSINRVAESGKYRRPVPCEQPFYMLVIHSDGDVSMCCGDSIKKVVVGNIHKVSSMKKILSSEILRSNRKSLLNQSYKGIQFCKSCSIYSEVDCLLFDNRLELLKLLNK